MNDDQLPVEITDKKFLLSLRKLPDCREEVNEGDIVFGIWFGDDKWWKFKAEKLDYGRPICDADSEMGLGFSLDISCYDIGYAYHIVKM